MLVLAWLVGGVTAVLLELVEPSVRSGVWGREGCRLRRGRAWGALLEASAPGLEGSPILADFLRIMDAAPILPAPLRRLQRLKVRSAVQITPEPVRSLAQLRGRGLHLGEAALVRTLAPVVARLPLGGTPPVQADRRLAAGPGSSL